MVGIIIFAAGLCVVIVLAVFSAQKLAAGVGGLLEGKGKGVIATGKIATFTVSFISFLFAILMVFGLFFGR